MEVPSGSVVDFRTRDLWDHPDPGLTQPWDGEDGAFAPIPDADLNFDNVYQTLEIIQRGILWLVYPCSLSSSSLSEIPDQRRDKKPMNNTLLELSIFHEKVRSTMDVQFILEITSSISLRSSPPVFPKGFQNIFQNIF